MSAPTKAEETIGVTAFKSQCLGLIDDVAQGKTGRVVLLKHKRPIAAIMPIRSGSRSHGTNRRNLGCGTLSWPALYCSIHAPQSG
jgi:antitoxin (DNA-binding transcriptional repressor) of toxin-antitoxin stability system